MNGRKTFPRDLDLNAALRKMASATIFPILLDLGIEAALAHEGAFCLHQLNSSNSPQEGPREINVVVKYESELSNSVDDICNKVVAQANSGQSLSKTISKTWQLEYCVTGDDSELQDKKCRIQFTLSGGPFPVILEDFSSILYIQDVPVMPVHALLLQQVLLMSESDPAKRREVSVVLVQDCLDAVGDVQLPQLSPQWISRRAMDAVKLLVFQKQGRDPSRWIKLGINPHIFRTAGPLTVTTSHPSTQITPRVATPSVGILPPSPITDTNLLPQNVTPAVATPLAEPDHNQVVVKLVARTVVSVLGELGFDCAIFGSAACQLYGNIRPPGDLDILVLPPESYDQDQEWIKQQIVNRYPAHFALRLGKTPGATYRVLFYKFGYGVPIPSMFAGARECKVDILVPGIMDLPRLTSSDIVWRDGLPIFPFLTLLVQKLQAWGDHLDSSEPHKFKKHPVDAQDVVGLLSLSESLPMTALRPWREKSLMSTEFQVRSLARVKRLCRIFPATKPSWRMLGFDVE